MTRNLVSSGGWYLSFVDKTGFRGGAFIVEADYVEAIRKAWRLGINPGGEVGGIPCDPLPPTEWVERLLTREEVESNELFEAMRTDGAK